MTPKQRMEGTTALEHVRAFFAPEIKSWRGEQPLGTVFWVYGVLVSAAFGLLYAVSLAGDRIGLEQVLLPCMAVYTFWLLVSLWRSGKRATNPFWGTLARQLVVVWALNTIMLLTFLQLDLVARYLDLPSVHRDVETCTGIGACEGGL